MKNYAETIMEMVVDMMKGMYYKNITFGNICTWLCGFKYSTNMFDKLNIVLPFIIAGILIIRCLKMKGGC